MDPNAFATWSQVMNHSSSFMTSLPNAGQFRFGLISLRAQELCESRGGHPGLSVPNSPYGPCGRKANSPYGPCGRKANSPYGPCGRKANSPYGPCGRKANSPYGPCGRKATMNLNSSQMWVAAGSKRPVALRRKYIGGM